ncbi:MAG: hypothetical protein KC776_42930 [Myxococcales bacterium]|nr:hypothetical protein [Myxococcales bacterium]MCB9582631.1 hypothetical protein [Polyangiaceae bacterium]
MRRLLLLVGMALAVVGCGGDDAAGGSGGSAGSSAAEAWPAPPAAQVRRAWH